MPLNKETKRLFVLQVITEQVLSLRVSVDQEVMAMKK